MKLSLSLTRPLAVARRRAGALHRRGLPSRISEKRQDLVPFGAGIPRGTARVIAEQVKKD